MALDLVTVREGMTHRKAAIFRQSVCNTSPILDGPRNSYLAMCTHINPHIIARTIDRIMKRQDPMMRHQAPPLMCMHEAVPNVYAPKVDKTRAREAAFRRKLPRLRRDLDGNHHTMTCALYTLVDVLHDPERVPEAVRVGIHEKLPQLMFDKTAVVRERCLAVIETMSNMAVGRDAILGNPKIIQNIKVLLFDEEDAVRFRAALALRMMVLFRMGPYDMDEGDLAPYLAYVLRWETETCVLKAVLFSFVRLLELKSTKEECVHHGAFHVLGKLMGHTNNEVARITMLCMGRLASCPAAEIYSKKPETHFANSLELRKRLHSENAEVAAAAADFLKQITNTTLGKQTAFNNDLHKPLLKMIHNSDCRHGQLMGFQTLNNMLDNANCRSALLNEDFDFFIEDAEVDRARQRMVANLRWAM